MATETKKCSYLPEELWLRIFTKILNSSDNPEDSFKNLSVVSKQFLTIINRHRISITITDKTISSFHSVFQKFPNLKSINFNLSSKISQIQFNELLTNISTFPNLSHIKSLSLSSPKSDIPTEGLLALSKRLGNNLTSFTCSRMNRIYGKDLFFVADCFPFLEELKLTYPVISDDEDFVLNDRLLALPKLRKINLTGNFIDRPSINHLCKNCHLLQEVKIGFSVL
jgi:F-box and leucine-rich repeat protein 2/20